MSINNANNKSERNIGMDKNITFEDIIMKAYSHIKFMPFSTIETI